MIDAASTDSGDALRAIANMTERAERARDKFAPNTPQHSLQANRIHALRVAGSLLSGKAAACTNEDVERAKAPLASLIRKSEKARDKLREDSWQHGMLCRNLEALCLAWALLETVCDERQKISNRL